MESILVFDCGGTHTQGALYGEDNSLLREKETGPSNPISQGLVFAANRIIRLGQGLIKDRPKPKHAALGISGAHTEDLRSQMAQRIGQGLGVERVWVSDDRLPLVAANLFPKGGVIVIAGTGASVMGYGPDQPIQELGGRGARIGDDGSAFRLGLLALRACAQALDGVGPQTSLLKALPLALKFKDFSQVLTFSHGAKKEQIAGLAKALIQEARKGDQAAQGILNNQTKALAKMALSAFTKLGLGDGAPLFFAGGLIENNPLFQEAFIQETGRKTVALAPIRGAEAVLAMARRREGLPLISAYEASAASRTEMVQEGLPFLDDLTALQIVQRMHKEDKKAAEAVHEQEEAIAETMETAADSLSNGGRLIYGGAGTSGRLGVLDASECPPTFGVDPDTVIGLMAGGDLALRRSLEGVEDDPLRGAKDLEALSPMVNGKDLVIGISASGGAAYVKGMLKKAKTLGAKTCLLCCNPECAAPGERVIALNTGPEVLAGSTRLKAGSATKMALNMISTGAMALAGRVYQGRMVGMAPANKKLRARAIGILCEFLELEASEAESLFNRCDGEIATSLLVGKKRLKPTEARRLLSENDGSLKAALEGKH